MRRTMYLKLFAMCTILGGVFSFLLKWSLYSLSIYMLTLIIIMAVYIYIKEKRVP